MSRRPATPLLMLVAGFVLWSIAFVALYTAHGLTCAMANATTLPLGGLAPSLTLCAFLAAHLLLYRWIDGRVRAGMVAGPPLIGRAAVALAVGAAGATLWTGMVIAVVPNC